MKRFSFRLERVLQIKRQGERQAELRQRQAQSRADLAKVQLRITRERMNRNATALTADTGRPGSAAERIAAMHYLSQLQRAVDDAESQVRKAEQLVQEANVQRAKIHREVESLNLLRRRQWHEHRRSAAQATQQELDDMSLGRWQLNRASDQSASRGEMEVMEP